MYLFELNIYIFMEIPHKKDLLWELNSIKKNSKFVAPTLKCNNSNILVFTY